MSASAAGRAVLRKCQRLLPQSTGGVVILAYHLVDAGTDSPVDLPFETFRRQLEEIRHQAEPVSLRDGLERLGSARRGGAPRPLVVVTFDDAYENFYRVAWPLLRELAIPVTIYVPTGFVDGEIGPPIRGTDDCRAATWTQLEELTGEDLVTIGSHGVHHVNLARASDRRIRVELEGSRRRLQERLGAPVEHFCYPEGATSPRTEDLAGEVYLSAAAAGGRRLPFGFRRFTALPRIPIRRDMPPSLEPVLTCPVWLEEWVASRVRGLRAGLRCITP